MGESTRRRGIVPSVGVALLLLASACKRDVPAPGVDPAASASASSAPTEDPKTPKKVTKKDCSTWAEHAVAAFLSSVDVATARCPTDARDAVRKKFKDEVVTLQGGAEGLCLNHLEETYLAGDAACFMKATDALTLRACKLAPMTPPDDDDWGLLLKSIHDRCGIVGMGSAPPPPSAAPSVGRPATSK